MTQLWRARADDSGMSQHAAERCLWVFALSTWHRPELAFYEGELATMVEELLAAYPPRILA